jgi:hypothetical protein
MGNRQWTIVKIKARTKKIFNNQQSTFNFQSHISTKTFWYSDLGIEN